MLLFALKTIWLSAILLLAFVAVSGCRSAMQTAGSAPASAPDLAGGAAGESAADAPTATMGDFGWRLRSVDGDTIRLVEFGRRPIVLNVWATWCPPCVAELSSFAALRQRLGEEPGGDAVAFVFIAPETVERVATFARRHTLDLPYYVELDAIPTSFQVRALPTTIVLDRDGRVVLHHRGAADWNTPAMRDLLLGLAR